MFHIGFSSEVLLQLEWLLPCGSRRKWHFGSSSIPRTDADLDLVFTLHDGSILK